MTTSDHLDGSQDDLVIRIETEKGLEGIGEVDASPEIVKAIVEAPASHAWSRGLRDVILGENPFVWRDYGRRCTRAPSTMDDEEQQLLQSVEWTSHFGI